MKSLLPSAGKAVGRVLSGLRSLLPVAALATALSAIGSAQGAPIAINNHSFERATYVGANSWTNDLIDPGPTTPGALGDWVGQAGTNNGSCFIERIGGFVSQGLAHVGMQDNYYIFQNTGVPYQPNTKYTLTVGVGNRNTGFSPAGSLSIVGFTVLDEPPSSSNFLEGLNANDQLLVDDVLAANHEIVDSGSAPWTSSTFRDVIVEMTTDNNPPQGNIVIFLGDDVSANRSHFDNVRLDAVSALDPDGDGLPTDWEVDNGLDPNSAVGDDGANGDPDNDNSPNSQEFARATNPQDPDTDNDGANDGIETGDGTFDGPNDIGTDPLNPDSDSDTLTDGSEVAANPFVTDPNKRDTDGDEFEDQAEITAGTDPTQAGSVPSLAGDLIVGINFIGGRVDGTQGASVTGSAGVVAQENWNNLADLGGIGAPLDDAQGMETLLRCDWTVDDTFTVDFGPPQGQNSALMQGFLKTRSDVLTQVTIRNIAYESYDVYVYADGDRIDGVADYDVNGVTRLSVRDTENWPIAAGGGTFVEIRDDFEAGNYMVFRGLTGPTVTITATNRDGTFGAPINGVQIVRAEGDTDGDGMPDIWEDQNGTDKNVADDQEDPDGDLLVNIGEFQRGTNPQEPDTDDDGFNDNVETGTGTFVSLQDTGTNPLRPDTDGDGLRDGLETNSGSFNGANDPGTNPHDPDTDDDAYSDGDEIAAGTNPLDPNSFPPLPIPIGYWPFDDQGTPTTEDVSPAGNDGNVNGGAVYVTGHTGDAGDYAIEFNGSDASVTTDLPLLDNLEQITMSGWVRFEFEQAARTGFFGQNDANEFGMINANTISWWMPTGGALDLPFGPTAPEWTHIAVVGDANGRRVYVDGTLLGETATPFAVVTSAFNFNIGGSGVWDGDGNWFLGEMDDIAVWDVVLSEGEIQALASGELTPLGPPAPKAPFTITNIVVDKGAQQVQLTWNSVPNALYSIYRSTDAKTWLEIDDSIESEGASTDYIDIGAPTDEANLFYQVERTD